MAGERRKRTGKVKKKGRSKWRNLPKGRCIDCRCWHSVDESDGYCGLRGMITPANHSCERWERKRRGERVGEKPKRRIKNVGMLYG